MLPFLRRAWVFYSSPHVSTLPSSPQVRSLADSGVTVCATIHSPTSYCFNLFDRLTMLVGGKLVYFGAKSMKLCGGVDVWIVEVWRLQLLCHWVHVL